MAFGQPNKIGCKSDRLKTATTRHLTKIIVYLSLVKYAHHTQISEKLGIESSALKDGINFLLNYKIIFRYGATKVKRYALNPLFKK